MSKSRDLDALFEELAALAPKGYFAGILIRYAAPLYMRSNYHEAWQKEYRDNSYALRDPMVFHGVATRGYCRWSEIRLPDPFNVMGKARANGLLYGAVLSCGPITSRSIVGVARDDREFEEDEMKAVLKVLERIHEASQLPKQLTDAMIEALRYIGDGYRHTAAAAELGVSESALKARLSAARMRLDARTTSEAVRKAREHGIL